MSTPQNELTLQELVQKIQKATDDFSALSLEASSHLGNIAKERTALGVIRERLIGQQEPAQGLKRAAWDAMWRDDVNRAAYQNAEAVASLLHTRIGDLIWDLFDFRPKENQTTAKGGAE